MQSSACLLSTGTEEGLLGGLDAASSRISINVDKCLPKRLLQPILQISKGKVQGGGRGRISRRRSNATSVFDGTAISGCAREVC
jgi:hypothetical protein